MQGIKYMPANKTLKKDIMPDLQPVVGQFANLFYITDVITKWYYKFTIQFDKIMMAHYTDKDLMVM